VKYTAADGLAIEGVLTLPRAARRKSCRSLYAARRSDRWVDDALASTGGHRLCLTRLRGVPAELSAAPRDMAGFRQAGYGEWGRKMLSDLSDGVTALAVQGVIDPKRACVVGASYGAMRHWPA